MNSKTIQGQIEYQLTIVNNNLKYLTSSICLIYDQFESLDIDNNDICTPNVPDCLIKVAIYT